MILYLSIAAYLLMGVAWAMAVVSANAGYELARFGKIKVLSGWKLIARAMALLLEIVFWPAGMLVDIIAEKKQ